MFGETALAYTSGFGEVAASPIPNSHKSNLSSQNSPSVPNQDRGIEMGYSNGTYARKFRGRFPANSSRPTSPELADWFADQLRGLSCKEVALLAECSERAAENVKLGKCAPNGASMTAIFRNDPDIGAAYMEYIGVIVPGQAESAAAYTRFANAAVRAKG